MNCPDFKTLMLMLDGELHGEELKAVSEHLMSCSKCRKIIDSQRNLETSWRDSLEVPDSEKFRSMEQRIFNRTYHRRGWRAYIPAVAGIIAVLLGVKLILNSSPSLDRVTDLSRRDVNIRGFEMEDAESLSSGMDEFETASRSETDSGSFELQVSDATSETFYDTTVFGRDTGEELSPQTSPVEESESIYEVSGGNRSEGIGREINSDGIATGNSSAGSYGGGGFSGYSAPEESDDYEHAAETITIEALENTAGEVSTEEISDISLLSEESISGLAVAGSFQSMPSACDEQDRATEQSDELRSSFNESLNESLPGGEIFVKLAFNAGGFPDSITALLLDSLVVDWIDYIPFRYSDTVLIVPLADVQKLLTGENAVPVETME